MKRCRPLMLLHDCVSHGQLTMAASSEPKTKRQVLAARHVQFATTLVSDSHDCALAIYLTDDKATAAATDGLPLLTAQDSWLSTCDYRAFALDRLATVWQWRDNRADKHRLLLAAYSSSSIQCDDSSARSMRGLEMYENQLLQDQWTLDRMLHRVGVLQVACKQRLQLQQALSTRNDKKSHEEKLAETSRLLSKQAISRARQLADADEAYVAKEIVAQLPSTAETCNIGPILTWYQHLAFHDAAASSAACNQLMAMSNANDSPMAGHFAVGSVTLQSNEERLLPSKIPAIATKPMLAPCDVQRANLTASRPGSRESL